MREKLIRQLSAITEEERRLLAGAPIDLSVYNRTGVPIMDPAKLLPDGKLFGIRMHTRFAAFPEHAHRYVEMIYQIQGQTRHVIDRSQPLTLREGQLLLLSRGTSHRIEAASAHDLAVNFILIPAFFDSTALQLGSNNALAVFLRGNLHNDRLSAGHMVFDISQKEMPENLLENLILGQLQGASDEIQQLTLELLLRHLSGMAGDLILATQKEREQAIVLQLLSSVEQNVRVSLSELAQQQNMDISALSRLIKKYTGCTFTELLHTARFSRAAALLRDTELSVVDIAACVGYENTAFFYRRFEQRYGCTPAAYRKARAVQQQRQNPQNPI